MGELLSPWKMAKRCPTFSLLNINHNKYCFDDMVDSDDIDDVQPVKPPITVKNEDISIDDDIHKNVFKNC